MAYFVKNERQVRQLLQVHITRINKAHLIVYTYLTLSTMQNMHDLNNNIYVI